MAHIQGLSFSLSFSLSRASSFFLSFQIPLYVSRVRTGVHANSRVFPFLSLPSRSLSESLFVSSRTRTYVHTRIFAHAIHVIFLLPPSHVHELSFSLSLVRIPGRTSLHLLRNRTVPSRPVPRLPPAPRPAHSFNRAEHRRGEESLVMAS